jgi:hypothetical protein
MEVKIKVPNSLMDVTCKQFIDYINSEKTDFDVLRIFYNVPIHYANLMPISEVRELVAKIDLLFSQEQPFQNVFHLAGEKFGFMPKLDDMTISEYADLDTFASSIDDIPKMMAVMYRPITKEKKGSYLIEPYIADITYHEVMESAPISIYLGAKGFFLTLKRELLKLTMGYLDKEAEWMNSQRGISSHKSGDGTHHYMNSLREMLEDLEMSEESIFTKH